jgi:hypothetical protein
MLSGAAASVDEVRVQLSRILASPEFVNDDGVRLLLRLIVEKAVCGEADVLTDQTLALEMSTRAGAHYPVQNIGALGNILRDKLAKYYRGEGSVDALLIELPARSFVPVFANRLTLPEKAGPDAVSRWSFWLFGGCLAAFLFVIGISLWTRKERPVTGPILTRITSDIGVTSYPALSRDGALLAYASNRSGDGSLQIWVQHTDGADARRLTHDPHDDREPAFSPDGKMLAFRGERKGGGVYVIPFDGGEEKLIAPGGRGPRYSPDGKWIAYWVPGENFHPGRIFIIPAAGGEPVRLRADFEDAHQPLWAPDGKHILFCGTMDAARPEAGHDWWVTPVGGGAAIRTGAFAATGIPASTVVANALDTLQWSGDHVLYSIKTGDSANVWRIRISPRTYKVAGEPERLTFGSSLELHAAAAGGHLVFTSGEAHTTLYGLSLDPRQSPATFIELLSRQATGICIRLCRGAALKLYFFPIASVTGTSGRKILSPER